MTLEEDYKRILIETFSAFEAVPGHITLVLYSEHAGWLGTLATSYVKLMQEKGAKVLGGAFLRKPPKELLSVDDQGIDCVSAERLTGSKLLKRLRSVGDETGAVGLRFANADSALWLRQESGLHLLEREADDKRRCQVLVVDTPLEDYLIELDTLQRAPNLKKMAIRRQFESNRGIWRDTHLDKKGSGVFSDELLGRLMEDALFNAAREAL